MLATRDSKCYVCGPDNPQGLQVPFQRYEPNGSVAHYRARPEHGGWNGILHGGVTFALMDEALGWALFYQDHPAVNARAGTKFHKPVPVGAEVVVKAWVVRKKGDFLKPTRRYGWTTRRARCWLSRMQPCTRSNPHIRN